MAANCKFFRLVAVGMGLPFVLVASDELLLAFAQHDQGRWPTLFVWLVVQTGVMSWAAGKWLEGWRWRAVVLSWTLLLLNIVLFHAAALASQQWRNGAFDPEVLAVAFVAAQSSLLAAWLVLGASAWQWRLPATAVAILPAGLVIAVLDQHRLAAENIWKQVAALQVIGTLLFAVVLRWRGYRVERLDETAATQEENRDSSAAQFSLSHLLVWTAALAPILLLLQAINYTIPGWLEWRQWLLISAEGVLLAPVSLVALWAALGAGRRWPKVFVLAAMGAAMATALQWVESAFGARPAWLVANGPGVFIAGGGPFAIVVTYAGPTWRIWTELSAFLLAGMLLVFRVDNYRLIRRKACP